MDASTARGSKKAQGGCAYRAARADRLKLLIVPARVLAFRLSNLRGPFIANLPKDVEVIACREDRASEDIVVAIRSEEFPRIAKDAVIPRVCAVSGGPALDGVARIAGE
jgi:hypothetical protein